MDLSMDLPPSAPQQMDSAEPETVPTSESLSQTDVSMDLSEVNKRSVTPAEPMDIDKDLPSSTVVEENSSVTVSKSDLPKEVETTEKLPLDSSMDVEDGSKTTSFLAGIFPGAEPPSEVPSASAVIESSPASPTPEKCDSPSVNPPVNENVKEDGKVSTPITEQVIDNRVEADDQSQIPSPEQAARRISPRLQSTVSEEDSIREAEPKGESPVVSDSPKPPPPPKSVARQLPIAGKTIRQRKSSVSPNGVEPKKSRSKPSPSPTTKPKKKPPAVADDIQDGRNDFYCWICHKEGEVLCCELCPRVFHAKCLSMKEEPEGDWFCPECETITNAECKETQTKAMSMLTLEQFSLLLRHVIQRMKIPMSDPFHDPVDTKMFPDYRDYVFHPMDLSTIERHVRKKKYGCPEAFTSEFKWIIHNCVIYNGSQSKLTQTAKSMLKVAEGELGEIEVCPECYLNSCKKRDNWFCEPCKELHPLVWAKLQGFPHWPGKALRIEKGMVDVRFFGQHDRAWIPLSGCYLISKELPSQLKNKKKNKGVVLKGGLEGAMQEMQIYIDNVRKITGEFEYAPPRTLLTHIDMYGKPGRTTPGSKTTGQSEIKMTSPAIESVQPNGKVKVESKESISGKDIAKARVMDSLSSKKTKTVTTSGEHPTRLFATKKKKASMELLSKTIESCKASCGIDTLQDIKLASTSEETTSSSDEEDSLEGKEKTADVSKQGVSEKSSMLKAAEDDDSDAELVIDLGDMEDGAGNEKKNKDTAPKLSSSNLKKPKADISSEKQLKSILHPSGKPPEKDERRKQLVKALSDKIGGKRKTDPETAGNSSVKMRKMVDNPLQVDSGSKLTKAKEVFWKKPPLVKEIAAKPKPGILKNSGDSNPLQRKEGFSDRKMSDQFKHKGKDGPYKSILKKSAQQDKPSRIVQIPTEADTRKLFNGGRIPRKNPATNVNDEEQDKRDDFHTSVEPSFASNSNSRSRGNDNHDSVQRLNPTMQSGNHRQSESARPAVNEAVARTSLKKYSDKVMETVQKVFHEMYTDMMVPLTANVDSDAATPASATAMHEVAQLRLELQRLKWMHEQEIAELKHNKDLAIAEIRQSLEFEKKQMLLEAKTQADADKKRAVDETKRKQWCAYCGKEAIFYCCWNTSYCHYPCQQKHWPQHMHSCAQAKGNATQPSMSDKSVEQAAATIGKISHTAVIDTLMTKSAASTPSTKISVKVPRCTTTTKMNIDNKLVASASGVQCPVSLSKSVGRTDMPGSPKSQKILSVQSTTQSQKTSGSAISAIGARLLAAKQRPSSGDETAPIVVTTKISDAAILSTSLPKSVISSSATDHVKVAMESPLSPDAAPKSPAVSLRKISADSTPTVESKLPPVSPKNSADLSTTAKEKTPKEQQAVSNEISKSTIPLLPSILSSSSTSSKVELSLSGSAFTKVVPETDKQADLSLVTSKVTEQIKPVEAFTTIDMDKRKVDAVSSAKGSDTPLTPVVLIEKLPKIDSPPTTSMNEEKPGTVGDSPIPPDADSNKISPPGLKAEPMEIDASKK